METRRLVLVRAGFDVQVAFSLERTTELLCDGAFDLLIFCHSLLAGECQAALQQAHSLQPAMKTLILSTAASGCEGTVDDFHLRAFIDPFTLITTVTRLTGDHSPVLERQESMSQFKDNVRWFNNAKGYGFLGTEGGPDVFIHFSSIESEGYKSLKEGEPVEFDVVTGEKGRPQADKVKRVDAEAGPEVSA